MVFQEALNKSLRSFGKRTAIESDDGSFTFDELRVLSGRITRYLLDREPGPEVVIGVQLSDQTKLICSIIGILNARCIFVPLNCDLPDRRLTAMIGDLNLKYLILSKTENGLYGNKIIDHLEHFFWEDMITGYEDAPLKEDRYPDFEKDEYPGFQEDDGIYIYFTSGSTGKPKGIVGKNSSLLQYIKWEIGEFNIDGACRVSQFISPYFDAFLRDIFVPILTGGTICIPPKEDDFFTPPRMISWIDRSGISLVHCVPSLFRLINNDAISATLFKSLKYVLLSGEKIIPSELIPWYDVFGSGIQLVNLYGATETTMIRSFHRISPEDARRPKIPIGTPIADTELLILNKELEPCDMYMPGELVIISPCTTRGYLNEPELTHERFLTLPASGKEGALAFRTGDRARMLPGKEIDLIGREDRQIKLRGIRVEPDEIEYILSRSALVRNAVVAVTDESLTAFVVTAESAPRETNFENELQAYLREYLPVYMIPSAIVVVPEFPLLSNGKINYKELSDMAVQRCVVEAEDATERKLLSVWKEILGEKEISTEDSFHQIGGNSLSIMRLIAKIYKEFNVRVSLSELFNNLTIRKQALLIKRSGGDNFLSIAKAPVKSAYNLSSAQERIHYNYLLDKTGTAFNLPMVWEVRKEIDTNKLQKAFEGLIGRHESLRTEFTFIGDRVRQIVKNGIDFTVHEIKLENLPVEEAILQCIRPFDLENAPLIRCMIITVAGEKKMLLIDVHHIVCDGMSQVNLLSDLSGLYKGKILNPLPIQYKDYAEWEYNMKMTDEYVAAREFWLKGFEGNLPELRLPVNRVDEKEISSEGGSHIFRIDRAVLMPVLEALREDEIPVFPGLLSVFFVYLSQLTGQEELVIGINTSGRVQEELQEAVGMFAKTLPIRYKVDPDIYFRDFVRALHNYLMQAYNRQMYDLTDIMRELNKNRNTPVENLFETMFSFQNFEHKKPLSFDEQFSEYAVETIEAKYPIHLFASEEKDSFLFRFEYLSAYFTKEDIGTLSKLFQDLVKTISENMDARIIEYIDSSTASAKNADLICL